MERLGDLKKEVYQFSGRGEIYSFTVMYDAPTRFADQLPYAVALVRLEEGPMITAMLTDIEDFEKLYIGMPVRMVTRKLSEDGDRGLISYGYKFQPVE